MYVYMCLSGLCQPVQSRAGRPRPGRRALPPIAEEVMLYYSILYSIIHYTIILYLYASYIISYNISYHIISYNIVLCYIRLHVAVNVMLGKYIDAVVVDCSETAQRCVRYLKEHMLAPMTFLPLRDLKVSDPDPRVAELTNNQSTLRLGLNCVSFDEKVASAYEFLLRDTVYNTYIYIYTYK